MSVYGGFADSPGQIKKEGEEISLKYIRNADGTATISWNIPPPAAGCSSENQAYDGIVITVDNKAPDFIKTSPKDGTFYKGDSTVDRDMHLGDKLDTALVVGAFYNDKKTTSLVVTDLQPRTSYYFSAYAVDNVGRYHREGVHSFSLPTGPQETNKAIDEASAYHDILIDVLGGISPNRPTGLDKLKTYNFVIEINGTDYTITINGVDALTYKDLVEAINKQFKQLQNPIMSPHYPNLGGYYWDAANKRLYKFDGIHDLPQPAIVSALDPTIPILGTVWYDPKNNILREYETGGWVIKQFLSTPIDPTKIELGQLWYDGVDVWRWDGNHWCKLCIYISTRNPSLPPLITGDSYWYDIINKQFFSYNPEIKTWDEVLVILSHIDPNALNTGDFWFNETDNFVYQFVGGTWNKLNDIRYKERNEDGEIDFPAPDTYWFIPSEMRLYLRNHANTEWVEQFITLYPTDPRDRKSCDLWFNESLTSNSLFVWDEINSVWKPVAIFYQSGIDPALPPSLPECAIWYDPVTKKMKLISGVTCTDAVFIEFPIDPTNPAAYLYWYNVTNKTWNVWDGTKFVIFNPVISELDPFIINVGEFWFDLTTNTLKQWNGMSWTLIPFSTTPLGPTVGTLWYNTIEEELYVWNGTTWIIANPIATLTLQKPVKTKDKKDARDLLDFRTALTGCNASIEVKSEDDSLFSKLSDGVIYLEPVIGSSGIDAGPMYLQIGVGDDGSPDERRALHDYIRDTLGGMSVKVELGKNQINNAIDDALLQIRKYSSLGYKRGMFFLKILPNQQTYILSDKCVGFNKIVDINAIYRMGNGFYNGAAFGVGGDAAFGIGALQQLYSAGSFDMLSFHLVTSFMEDLDKLFAGQIMFQWIERTKELKMYKRMFGGQKVLLDVTVERTEQDLISDRETKLWIRNWAVAHAKLQLSQVRGKFQQLPGPNGSTSLNTQDLITQATAEMEKLKEELEDFAMQDMVDTGLRAHFILG